jgi:hypothetical protein
MAVDIRQFAGGRVSDRRWWLQDEGKSHHALVGVAAFLAERSRSRHEMDRRHLRLYGGAEYFGLFPGSYSRVLPTDLRVAWNVVQACSDTYVAKMVRSTPAPMFLTSGADYDVRRKAEKLNKFGKGCLHQSNAYRIAPTIERDAAIFGTGCLHVYSDAETGRVCSERVYPWEILVDDVEAMYGEPRQLIRRKFIDRSVLAELYGAGDSEEAAERRRAIERAPEPARELTGRDTLSDQVEVWEAWHLRSSQSAQDGRHVIAVQGATLFDEPWERDRFPFAFRRYVDPVVGFWGIGISERLTGIQLEINKLLMRIQRAHHLLGRPIVVLDETSGIPKTHITNEVAAVLVSSHPGDPIKVHAPPTMPPDVYSHLMTLRAQAFEEVGVSALDSSARKPAGLNSGASIREYSDIGSERFLLQGKRREEWFLDVVRLCLDEAREMDGFSVDVPGRSTKERVDWSSVSLEDDAYFLQCYPAALLPSQPSGRVEKVQELIATGMIPREQALELLDIPDLDESRGRLLAGQDAARSQIASILDGMPAPVPEALDDLRAILQLGQATYLQERTAGAPEERLEALRQYLMLAADMMRPPAAETVPEAAPIPGAPAGPEMMTA